MSPVTDVNDQRLVIGTDETRHQAREELRLHVAVQRAMRSGLPEFPRGDLDFQRFGIVEHRHTGALYRVRRGQLDDPDRSGAVGFFIAGDGFPAYLEQPPGPKTREEREAQREALEQRKAERAAEAALKPWARKPRRGGAVTPHLYYAKLAPLDQDLLVHGREIDHFHRSIFALERKEPTRVRVLLDHKDDRDVGHLETLFNSSDGWLTGTFRLNQGSSWSGVAEDMLKVGTPVSIGFLRSTLGDWLGDGIKRLLCGELQEVSIVDKAAIRGAEITHKIPLTNRAVPRPAQPTRTTANTAPSRKPAPKPQPVNATYIHRGQSISDRAWKDELERRLDWIERSTGRPADFEAVLRNLKREMHGPTIDEAYAEMLARRMAA